MTIDRKARLKVAQVLFSGLGGHASVAFSLIGGDLRKEWDASLLFVGVEALVPAYVRRCETVGVPYESVRSHQGRPWRSWPSIYKALRRLAPEAVILHSISSLLPVALYCLVSGARLIAVEHTPLALKTRAERVISSLALVFARRVVVLTNDYRVAYLQSARLLGPSSKIEVIANGIDVDRYKPGVVDTNVDAFRIGMAARFSSTKRQDVLVLAMALLKQRQPRIRWSLTLAGSGDRLDAVRDIVDSQCLSECVEFAGNLDEAGLVAWFQTLNLYVHASEGETLSTSMLQAMSAQLPVVASDVPGIRNLLDEDPPLGLLIPENSATVLAAAIERMHADPALRSKLSAAARAKAIRSYSCEAMFNAYNRLVHGAQRS